MLGVKSWSPYQWNPDRVTVRSVFVSHAAAPQKRWWHPPLLECSYVVCSLGLIPATTTKKIPDYGSSRLYEWSTYNKPQLIGPWGCGCNLKLVIFNMTSRIDILSISCENALTYATKPQWWSTLVQVMAWCRQTTSHYLNQCRSRSPMPYGVTRQQWVNKYN